MAISRRLLVAMSGLVLFIVIFSQASMTTQAGSSKNYLDGLTGGVADILNPSATNTAEILNATAKELNLTLEEIDLDSFTSDLVMANVKDALNVRSDASEEADKVGKLYKDCGGKILDRKNGWTKIQSGNLVGWAKDDYLLFGEDAEALAADVGKQLATITTESLRVRKEPSAEEGVGVYGLLPKGAITEVLQELDNGWVCIDYDGNDGFVSADYIELEFQIDAGETLEEIKIREEAEREAKRHVNYGEYTTDADTTLLLAALVHCEARGESYEGQLAVASVVMNRVRSAAYPNTIHGVIYASGQFTPAMNGKLNAVYESGNISESCIRAAQEALSGVSNVGDMTHFRRNNGREGLVIGNHVFY